MTARLQLGVMVGVLALLQLVDYTLTQLALELGLAVEANPLIPAVNGWVLAWKLGFACLLGLVIIRPRPWYVWGVAGVLAVYSALVVYLCVGLLVTM